MRERTAYTIVTTGPSTCSRNSGAITSSMGDQVLKRDTHTTPPAAIITATGTWSRPYANSTAGNQRRRRNATATSPRDSAAHVSATNDVAEAALQPSATIGAIALITLVSTGSVLSQSTASSQPRTPYSGCACARAAGIAIHFPDIKIPSPDARQPTAANSGQFQVFRGVDFVTNSKANHPPASTGTATNTFMTPANPMPARNLWRDSLF